MFEKIVAKNLFSWENLEYIVQEGISQITGFNHDDNTSEGSGKSSILNTLCWTLYGGIPKEAKIDEVVRQGVSGGEGKVYFLDGSSVYRSRKPNDLYLTSTTGKVIRGRDAKETQKLIVDHIGLDFDCFCQTVYFAQNYPNKFITSNESIKAQILSEVQDLTIFDRARKRVQDLLKKEELEFIALEKKLTIRNEIQKLYSNAELLTSFIDKFEDSKQNQLVELMATIEYSENTIKQLQNDCEALNNRLITQDTVETERMLKDLLEKKMDYSFKIRDFNRRTEEKVKLERYLVKLRNEITELAEKLNKYEISGNSCPICGEEVKKENLNHVFKEKISLEQKLDKLLKEEALTITELCPDLDFPIEKIISILKELEIEEISLKENLKRFIEEKEKFRAKSERLTNLQIQISDQIEKLEILNSSEPFEELQQLKNIEAKIDSLRIEESEITKFITQKRIRLDQLELLKNGFKEVKQYIFQTLLKELSGKSSKLAQELFEVPVIIRFFNETGEGEIDKIFTEITLDGQLRPLGLLSGGQSRRIIIAVDLAWASIVSEKHKKPINFRAFDEPFKDLSESSMEKVIKLLRKLKGSTIIIEHSTIIKSIIDNTFDVEYRNGISKNASQTLEMPQV